MGKKEDKAKQEAKKLRQANKQVKATNKRIKVRPTVVILVYWRHP